MATTINDFLKKYKLVDKQLSSYDNDTIQTITEVINGKIDNYIDSENGVVLLYIGLCYKHIKKDTKLAEQYFLMSAKYNNMYAMNNLGKLYEEQGKLDSSEKYYLMAADQNNSDAMHGLGILYRNKNKLDLAEEYFIMSINNNNHPFSMNSLGLLYKQQHKFDLAEKYYLMAIEHNSSKMAPYNLGRLYEEQHKFNLATRYYLKAVLFDAYTIKDSVRIIPNLSYESQLEILELVVQIRTNDEYLMEISDTVHTLFANKQMEMTRCLSNYLIGDLVNICLSYY